MRQTYNLGSDYHTKYCVFICNRNFISSINKLKKIVEQMKDSDIGIDIQGVFSTRKNSRTNEKL